MSLILKEHSSTSYAPRTYYNASSSDITVALAVDLSTAGEKLTHKAAGNKYIGFQLIDQSNTEDIAIKIVQKMKELNATTMNVAGNGIYTLSKYNCTQEFINKFVYEILKSVNERIAIKKIYTGGQTGVDIAGAVAAIALGIEVEVTFPKGFKQRFENKEDITQSREIIENQIMNYIDILMNKKIKRLSV